MGKPYDNFKEAKNALSDRIAYLETRKKKKTQTHMNLNLPSVPGQDLENSLNQITEIATQNLLNETEFDQEKKCLKKALIYIRENKETTPIDLTNFCNNQKIDKAETEIAKAKALLKDIEEIQDKEKCKNSMFKIGQQIRLIKASNNENDIRKM